MPDLWIRLKKAFLRPSGKPNISLPLLATLKDSPCPKTKRGTSPFVRASVQLRPRLRSWWLAWRAALVPPRLNTKTDWWVHPANLFLVLVKAEASGGNLPERDSVWVGDENRALGPGHNGSSARYLTNSYGRVIGRLDLGAVQCWTRGQFQSQLLGFFFSTTLLLAVNEPQSSKWS